MIWIWFFWQAVYLVLNLIFILVAFGWLTILKLIFSAKTLSWKATLMDAFLLFLIFFIVNQIFVFFPVSVHISPFILVPENSDLLSSSIRKNLFLPGISYPGFVTTLSLSFEKYLILISRVLNINLTLGLCLIAVFRWKLRARRLAIFLGLAFLNLLYFIVIF